MLKSCFNAYVLSRLEYCAPVWMSSAESHLGLLDIIVRNADSLCGGVILKQSIQGIMNRSTQSDLCILCGCLCL